MSRRLKILVLCGGPSSEHEVSLRTARMVMKNLDRRKYDPLLAVIQKNGNWRFGTKRKPVQISKAIKQVKGSMFDCAFIAMHGAFGEDGRVQALLEWIGLPYTGSGVLSSAMAMDKHISNTLYSINGLQVAKNIILDKISKKGKISLGFPVVVKPVNGGSSVGVSVVKTKKDLSSALRKAFREDTRVMVQSYVRGREFTCGILEEKDGEPFALPPTEIIPRISSFFDYRAKYKAGGSSEITPPQLSAAKIKKLQQLAIKAHQILGCRGISRSDFIMSGDTFFILETNTIPGLTETSLLPQEARAANISFSKLLGLIISSGLRQK